METELVQEREKGVRRRRRGREEKGRKDLVTFATTMRIIVFNSGNGEGLIDLEHVPAGEVVEVARAHAVVLVVAANNACRARLHGDHRSTTQQKCDGKDRKETQKGGHLEGDLQPKIRENEKRSKEASPVGSSAERRRY